MCEPLSITTGVVALLGVCLNVGVELKKFRNAIGEVRTTVTAMLTDVKMLRSVLETMEDTFEEFDTAPPLTGHIGTHWRNLNLSLGDASGSLTKLEKLLVDVNRDVKVLDAARKQIRLKAATEQIAIYRQQVQAYRDAMQFSLQTITFYTEVAVKEDTSKILDSSEAIHQDLTQLATNLDVKLRALELLFKGNQQQDEIDSVTHLRDCVQSAATVISSTSVVLAGEQVEDEEETTDFTSELGERVRPESSELTLQWIQSESAGPFSPASSAYQSAPSTTSKPIKVLPKQKTGRLSLLEIGEIALTKSGSRVDVTKRASASLFPAIAEVPNGTRKAALVRSDSKGVSRNRKQDQVPNIPPTEDEEALEEPKSQTRHRKSFSFANLFRTRERSEKQSTSQDGRLWQFHVTETGAVRLKIVLVGDGACGKTCFLIVGTKKLFPEVYEPTVFENYTADFEVDGYPIEAHFWDTAGQEEFDRLRVLSYPGTHITCVCFAIDSPDSLDNALRKWTPEIVENCGPQVPIFLLGLKKDTRDDPISIGRLLNYRLHHVTTAGGEEMRLELKAVKYLESSAKTGEGVQETFREIFTTALKQNPEMRAAAKKKRKRVKRWLFG